MAARNTTDGRPFVYRPRIEEPEPYYIPVDRSGSIIAQPLTYSTRHGPPKIIRSEDLVTPRTEVASPPRRIVVIRNTRNPQVNQEPVDLDDFGRSSSFDVSPRYNDGRKTVFLVRRPIAPPKPLEYYQTIQEPSPISSLELIRTPTPPEQMILSPDPPRTPNPRVSPPIRAKSFEHRSENSTRRSPSPSPLKQEVQKETNRKRNTFRPFSKKNTTESVSSPPPAIIENEQETLQYRPLPTSKNAHQNKSASSQGKSAKSAVLVHPDQQPIAVVDDSSVKGEVLKPVMKRQKSFKKTRFQDETLKTSRWHTCLGCLSRHMCLVIIICFIIILIGLAGLCVSAYFLATNQSSYLAAKIAGIVVGGVLAVAALCFLCILLACIGARDGYFKYNAGGPRTKKQKIHRSKTFTNGSNISTSGYDNKSNKNNMIIEMPEHFLTGRKMTPNARERSLTKIVKNIGHVVEDAKKRYNGDIPNKVVVKVDQSAMQTA